jgi:uncharacterized protein
MNKWTGIFIVCFLAATPAFCQVDSLNTKSPLLIFDRLTKDLKEYRPDTTAVPNDKITKVIIELRNLRGGFNINEAIEYKLEEDKQKKEISEADFESFSVYFKNGNGKKWLDNAVIWIYRQHFTYQELKQLVKFYKTPAGQKIATEFPVVMMKSLAAAEGIKNMYMQGQTNKK